MTGEPRLDLDQLEREALGAIAGASDERSLEQFRVQYLGRRSVLKEALSNLRDLDPEARRTRGQSGNALVRRLEEALASRAAELLTSGGALGAADAIDLTFPGAKPRRGHMHPTSRVAREMEDIFRGLGYAVERGPEVETDYYNFEALNIPAGHPARDNHDSFFIRTGEDSADDNERVLLRTHTSPMQVRVMERQAPPIKIVVPGRVYRRDSDATHVPMFHQLEGLYIDEGVTTADLRGTLEYFARAMFGADRRIRLRPDYFPFTEPSLEVHVSCFVCGGSGCGLCGKSGWIEILGAGMVHPNVLRAGGIDPDRYSGFAFGMGIDRIAMLKYGIDDMRSLIDSDLRLTRQF